PPYISVTRRRSALDRPPSPRPAHRHRGYHAAATASRASRPVGGAFGAPGPRGRCMEKGIHVSKPELADNESATGGGLTESHSISVSQRTQRTESKGAGNAAARADSASHRVRRSGDHRCGDRGPP